MVIVKIDEEHSLFRRASSNVARHAMDDVEEVVRKKVGVPVYNYTGHNNGIYHHIVQEMKDIDELPDKV